MSQVLVVVTGVPHSGKTTLVNELTQRGFHGKPEVARPIIERNLVVGGPLPWTDIPAFTAELWPRQVEQYEEAVAVGANAVFDRGLPDAVAFLEVLGGQPAPALMEAVACHRYTHVFLLMEVPRSRGQQDPVRPFSEDEQRAIERALFRVYREAGYRVEVVPLVSVEERAMRVLAGLGVGR